MAFSQRVIKMRPKLSSDQIATKTHKIVVIGLSSNEDLFTLFMIQNWLRNNRPDLVALADQILAKQTDVYDHSTLPNKGDAMDAIDSSTQLVVALHLFGIDKIPGGGEKDTTALDPKTLYNRDNFYLLQRCMDNGVPLISVGDQPWLGMEKRTEMFGYSKTAGQLITEPCICLYEKKVKA